MVAVEKFGFGMVSVGQMIYMMQQLAPGPFKMTHYAFATDLMALTKWATGSVNGAVCAAFQHRYAPYFGSVLVASIPPLVFAWVAPFPHGDHEDPAATA